MAGYNASDDTYKYGHNFSRDGSDYDTSYDITRHTSWFEILSELDADKVDGDFTVVVTGRLYSGRSTISGAAYVTDRKSMHEAISGKHTWSFEQLAIRILNMSETPLHITYVEIRPMN